MLLGKIQNHSLKKQWSHETAFSDWLAEDGLAMLGDVIGIELCDAKREVSVGGYSADIIAHEDGGNRMVVIENQYNTANHDHLGKVVTYAAGLGAKVIVWIVEDVRQEAISAVKWLNEISRDDFSFFLIKATLLQIDESALAPQFVVVEKPDEWSRETQSKAGELNERQAKRLEFWTGFADHAKDDYNFAKTFNPRKPSTDHWLNYFVGSSSYHIALTIKDKDQIGVEIYIPDDKDLYRKFEKAKIEIERELGFAMDWQPIPGKKASRIYYGEKINWIEQERRKDCFKWLADTAVAVKYAFEKHA